MTLLIICAPFIIFFISLSIWLLFIMRYLDTWYINMSQKAEYLE